MELLASYQRVQYTKKIGKMHNLFIDHFTKLHI